MELLERKGVHIIIILKEKWGIVIKLEQQELLGHRMNW